MAKKPHDQQYTNKAYRLLAKLKTIDPDKLRDADGFGESLQVIATRIMLPIEIREHRRLAEKAARKAAKSAVPTTLPDDSITTTPTEGEHR